MEMYADSDDIEFLFDLARYDSKLRLDDLIARAKTKCPGFSLEISPPDFDAAVAGVREQITRKLAESRPPESVNFYYFGLITIYLKKVAQPQMYLSGGTIAEGQEEFEGTDQTWYPEPTQFDCPLLVECGAKARANREWITFLDYFLILGVAILLVKAALGRVDAKRVFVGFDSGDALELK